MVVSRRERQQLSGLMKIVVKGTTTEKPRCSCVYPRRLSNVLEAGFLLWTVHKIGGLPVGPG